MRNIFELVSVHSNTIEHRYTISHIALIIQNKNIRCIEHLNEKSSWICPTKNYKQSPTGTEDLSRTKSVWVTKMYCVVEGKGLVP